MDDITFISIPTVHERTITYNMWKKWRKIFLKQIFHKGGPLWFFQFFHEVVKEKRSKMTFLPKKFQGSVQICLNYDFNLVKLKLGQKNFKQKNFIFFSNSQFSSSKIRKISEKNEKKNSVQHLKMYLRYHMPKIRHFWWWEPKNLWPPACIFGLLNIIPQDPVWSTLVKDDLKQN